MAGLLPLLIAAASWGCRTPRYDPFKVAAGALRGRVKTIALWPLGAPGVQPDEDRLRAVVEPLLIQRLTKGGFQVVPMAVVEAYRARAAEDLGDFYDRRTGKANSETWDTARHEIFRRLAVEQRVDAVLYTWVEVVDVALAGTPMPYCGSSGTFYWSGERPPVRATLARATCLDVKLVDREERELYSIRAGIEGVETYANQTRAVRPASDRFRDTARIDDAIELIVGPLADRDR